MNILFLWEKGADMTQEEMNELQKETLETMKEYLGNLIPSITTVIAELNGDMKEDTWEYLRMILDGFNWVIEAFNGIVDYIDKDRKQFDMAVIDSSVKKLSDAYVSKNGVEVANSLENDIIPFLDKLKNV